MKKIIVAAALAAIGLSTAPAATADDLTLRPELPYYNTDSKAISTVDTNSLPDPRTYWVTDHERAVVTVTNSFTDN